MAITRDSLIQEIYNLSSAMPTYAAQANAGYWGPNSLALTTQLKSQQDKRNQLIGMLGMVGTEGTDGSGGSGAPSTDNRFASGLSDAETRLRALLDNPDSIQQTGAYKFRVQQGQEALQRSMGAKGMLNSGNRLMELTKYGQDMGSQEYDNQAGRLSSLLGTYGQGYVADKNANTNIFSAQNTAKANNDRNALGWAGLNSGGSGGGSSRGMTLGNSFNPGGITGNTPVDWNAFNSEQTARRTALDRY